MFYWLPPVVLVGEIYQRDSAEDSNRIFSVFSICTTRDS